MMEKEIKNCISVLARGGTILYPTDTIWGIGCDATNPEAVEKVYKIKKRMESKSLIVLLDDEARLKDYTATVPEIAYDLLRSVDTPLTIIYPDARNLAPNVIAEDGSIAIRIVKNKFCKKLISSFGKPIVSTSANISGEPAPLIFKCIPDEIQKQVDYMVKLYQEVLGEVKPSTIIRLKSTGEFEIIRK
jgi:L-threonylcarbamoyladenylate synthase